MVRSILCVLSKTCLRVLVLLICAACVNSDNLDGKVAFSTGSQTEFRVESAKPSRYITLSFTKFL